MRRRRSPFHMKITMIWRSGEVFNSQLAVGILMKVERVNTVRNRGNIVWIGAPRIVNKKRINVDTIKTMFLQFRIEE